MQTMPEMWPNAVPWIIGAFQPQSLPHLEVSTKWMIDFVIDLCPIFGLHLYNAKHSCTMELSSVP